MDKNKTSVLVHFLIFLISEIFMTNCFSQMRFLFLPFNQMDQPGRLRPVFHLKISEVYCNKQREVLCTLYPCFTRIQKKKKSDSQADHSKTFSYASHCAGRIWFGRQKEHMRVEVGESGTCSLMGRHVRWVILSSSENQ